ncbi:hypothetical protein BST27_23605 [Mycobacterium intermedium]|uniref:DUF1772 domain-containing protein n=1 Tax=Mycobacterium intermedium TaxID=28445 RepID=A0A1E3S6R1_MYCIE|nr:anthrone oxygenase family protein [Mycobacterium intermedium]MCV6962727.1 DUF1772 domain-containing protein [Mycobacterium intermedium]ODQ97863.1 hypothetical protein BHQ20_24750 [Mycobacterium intermedium]OPE48401.1 hypothetical protein BV508_18155 [Mycobacterium intermedium]ORA96958.1 hypothetical protein BST27_23605 [Mycobacterium intermedium]
MRINPLSLLALVAAIGSAAVGGLFFAFSTFVMRGLNHINPVEAILVMRGINAEAQVNTPFLVLFFGSASAALIVGIAAVVQLRKPGSGYLLAGAVLAVIAVLVTAAFNVPLNDQLEQVKPGTNAARAWHDYAGQWTLWNHVRTVCPLIGAALLVVGALRR